VTVSLQDVLDKPDKLRGKGAGKVHGRDLMIKEGLKKGCAKAHPVYGRNLKLLIVEGNPVLGYVIALG
jgi:hypothetical protein